MKALAGLVSGGSPILGSLRAILSLCPRGIRGRELSLGLSYKGTNPIRAALVAQGGKESACPCLPMEGDVSFILGSGRSPGEGNGIPLQYSCLGNPMD